MRSRTLRGPASPAARRGAILCLCVAFGVAAAPELPAQPLTFTHFAGTTGGPDALDGAAAEARFYSPNAAAFDAAGNLYVADTGNHTIRKMTPSGIVATVAGLAGTPGGQDGLGGAARFNRPSGVTVDGAGNVYVSDAGNHTIRKIAPSGAVTTLAGRAGVSGSSDGTESGARFYRPTGVAVDVSANVYVADSLNRTIRKVTPAGVVTTLAGSPARYENVDGIGSAAGFEDPMAVAVDGAGTVYVADDSNIRKITPDGVVTTLAGSSSGHGNHDGTGGAASFNYPCGIAVDRNGNVFVADTDNGTIRRITQAGVVTTLAGSEAFGSVDGVGSAATFARPSGVAVDPVGNVIVTEAGSVLRRVTPAGVVTTVAGLALAYGNVDGPGATARFWLPIGVAADGAGNVYVADGYAHTIRKITPAGLVSTLAGHDGATGTADGPGGAARFNQPASVAADRAGNVYLADQGNHTIRRISASGFVTTVAGLAGTSGRADGTGSAARFYAPAGVATDGAGNVYVADGYNHTIRRVTPAGVVTTLAGLAGSSGSADGSGSAARFRYPQGVATDSTGNVYVADTNSHTVRMITPSGDVTTLAGSAGGSGSADGVAGGARFFYPYGLSVDGGGNVWVADTFNMTIRKISPQGVVTTEAGLAGFAGSADGSGATARFNWPSSLACASSGRLYVADLNNAAIRVGTPTTLLDAAVIDASAGPVGVPRQLDASPRTATTWQWRLVRRPATSVADLSSSDVPNPTFTPDVADVYVFRLTASDGTSTNVTTVSLTATAGPVPGAPVSRLLPIVLDVASASAHYTTEMALTNNSSTPLTVSLLYTPALGSRQGGGTVSDSVAPGEQKRIGDVLSHLRTKGLAIPPANQEPSQGGTLLATFEGSEGIEPRLLSVTARTAALTSTPQPTGRAGLAYSALLPSDASTSALTIFGLRSTPTDRTNVAVFSSSIDPVTVRVTVHSGEGGGRSVVLRNLETLPPFGWVQYGSAETLDQNGIGRGWVTVERVSGTGAFGAYAVINDNATNDGSFVLAADESAVGGALTVPALVETPVFRSELTLANKSASAVTLNLDYTESLTPSRGAGGARTVVLAPQEQKIVPDAVEYLRTLGVDVGPKDAASYAGTLRITVSGTAAGNVFAGARTASRSPSPAGGQFGLFTPCLYRGQEATVEAYLYGLRSDAENRTNVAVLNAGDDEAGPILLQLQAYDGDLNGLPRGAPVSVALLPGDWAQPPDFFKSSGIVNGWVKVTRMSGSAPWIAYAVINDGGNPGERTGDGAYVPMIR